MLLAFVAGGRVFAPSVTHSLGSWPAGAIVFGRVDGPDVSIWSGVSAVDMRCLPASPGYNGCFCPADSSLVAVTSRVPTFVGGSIFSGDACNPCSIYTGTCPCTGPGEVCASCDAASGPAVAGNVESFTAGLGGLGLVSKFHRHLGAGSVPSPERIGLLLLQHHVVANDGGEF